MKTYKLTLLLSPVVILLFCFCATQRKQEIQNLEGASKDYQSYIKREFPKGSKLFKKYCSSCHGIYSKGLNTAPNFSKTQIDAYNLSFIQGDTANHAVAQNITQEEFELIMLFLTYRKHD